MLIATNLAFLLIILTILYQSSLVEAQSNGFAGGSGTEDDPYEIATAAQLDKVRDHLDKHFVLTANINLGVSPWNAGEGWEPIGSNTAPFTGTFDGNGFTISDLTIHTSTNDVGLFGVTDKDAEISNVKLKDVSITSNSYVGALVGLNNGKIENSSATGDVTGSGDYVGGLVGYNNGGSITNSYATGNVTGSYPTLEVTGSWYVGGLVGFNDRGSITNSYAAGDVTGRNFVGGLVGRNDGSITNSYAAGDVTGGDFVGGLVGRNVGGVGVVGGSIQNSFALNSEISVTGLEPMPIIGRVVGGNFLSTLINNYALATMTVNGSPISNSNPNDNHGADISEQWATTIFPYLEAGWDFTIWQINEGEYPTLRDSKVSAVNPSQPSITTNTGIIVKKDDAFTLKFCENETKATVSTTVEGDTKFFRWMDANEENQSLEASYDVSLGNEYQLEVVSGTGNRKTYGLEVKPGFDLKLQVNDPLEGSISGTAGCYSEGEEIELKAEANLGYRFVNWTIDGTEVSKQATFDYTMSAGDVTIVANFEKLSYKLTVQSNDSKAGTVTGGGTYEYGSEVTLKATPNEGYRFVNWTVDGKEVSKDQTFTYQIPAKNVEIVANFEKQSYELTVQSSDSKAGTVTGGGTYEYGSEVTLKATPNEGYRFVNWTVDGKEVSKDQTFTYQIPAKNVEIVANFEKLSYKLTVQASDNKAGTVTGSGTYAFGSEVQLKATPNEGYRFVNWTVDGDEVSTDPTFTFTIPAEHVEIVANFKKIPLNVEETPNEPKKNPSSVKETSNKPNETKKENSSPNLPKTATNDMIWFLVGIVFLSFGIVLLIIRKRKVY